MKPEEREPPWSEIPTRAEMQKEIERLAKECEQLRSDLELRHQTALDRKEIIRDLEAEIERLRAALREIADHKTASLGILNIARRALGEMQP